MISVLTMDDVEEEAVFIKSFMKELAAKLTDETWKYHFFTNSEDMHRFLEKQPLLNMACIDITAHGTMEKVLEYRKQYLDNGLLLITDANMSPLVYLKPGVRADSLIMRPFDEGMAEQIIRDFVMEYLERFENADSKKYFVFECQEGKITIPYRDIFYFESREKKVFLKTQTEEYGFHMTLEHLEQELPDFFIRCHRSFIVNSNKIQRVKISANNINLQYGMTVPLSRSYKAQMKSLWK